MKGKPSLDYSYAAVPSSDSPRLESAHEQQSLDALSDQDSLSTSPSPPSVSSSVSYCDLLYLLLALLVCLSIALGVLVVGGVLRFPSSTDSTSSFIFMPEVLNRSAWSYAASECLDQLRVGCWEQVNVTTMYEGEKEQANEAKWSWLPQSQCPAEHVWNNSIYTSPPHIRAPPLPVSCPAHVHLHYSAAQQCLKNRWLVFIGDSSTRFLYSAFVQLLSGQREPLSISDPHMPGYTPCPCSEDLRGASDRHQCCSYWYKGLAGGERVVYEGENQGTVWFRERLLTTAHGYTRLTFFFKTGADSMVGSLECLMTPPSQSGLLKQPDLMVLNTGAWDRGKETAVLMNDTAVFVSEIQRLTLAPLLWLNLPHCSGDPTQKATESNAGHRELMRERGIPVLPREETTWQFLDEQWVQSRGAGFNSLKDQCEGWHAHWHIAEAHTQILLNSVCQQQ